MSKLNEFADQVYVLNLDRRPDRWIQIQGELGKHNILHTRFPAIDARALEINGPLKDVNPSEIACSLSHLEMMKSAQVNELDVLCIFEDDAVLATNFEEQLEEAIQHLPENWDLLYLGANNVSEPEHVSGNIYKTKNSLTTHAYLVKSSCFTTIIEGVEKAKYSMPVDVLLRKVQIDCNAYVIKPNVVFQRAGFSDIRGGFRNYDVVLKN